MIWNCAGGVGDITVAPKCPGRAIISWRRYRANAPRWDCSRFDVSRYDLSRYTPGRRSDSITRASVCAVHTLTQGALDELATGFPDSGTLLVVTDDGKLTAGR